jgi:hypothetical protein
MGERKAVTKQMARRYVRASKTQKTSMLDELCELTGWTRRHARRALAVALAPAAPASVKSRPRIYGEETLTPLMKIWATLGGPSGKRLAPFMSEIVEVLERCGELEVSAETRRKLLAVSAATIDRMLAGERARLRVKGRSGTAPGSMLRRQIPIRTFADWDDAAPGFLEVDLVAHDGGSPYGQFCQSLDVVCVATGWTEVRALKNKAQRWCFEAMNDLERTLPFPILGVDSDNGSEFINHQLFRWCQGRAITFTRSRPYRKNDNCFVEQKNWPVVRQQVGYLRYDTAAELSTLAEIYELVRLWMNFFQPQMKLISKARRGATVTKHYDQAQTPYRRVLAAERVASASKQALTRTYLDLNPVELTREIGTLQRRLIGINRSKPPRKEVGPAPDHPFRRTFSWPEASRTFLMRQPVDASRTS